MAPRLDYDRSGVASRYDAGRQLSASARAAWATALGEAFGRIPAGLVIDVGCGTGRFAQVLLDDLGARVLGVEPAQEMARLARQSLPASARVLRAVAESLPLADATADGALLAFVYHHLTDPSAALGEIARVLRPGGRLVVPTPTLETLNSLVWVRFFPSAREIDEARLPDRGRIQATARRHGLALIDRAGLMREVAPSLQAYADRLATRTVSTLCLIRDEEFQTGLSDLRRHAATGPGPVCEDVDLFTFTR